MLTQSYEIEHVHDGETETESYYIKLGVVTSPLPGVEEFVHDYYKAD
jgi:hypothetical protein